MHTLPAEAIDAEIARRRANADGATPKTISDDAWYQPWGAIVDGYQFWSDAWTRIDHPGEIDVDALNMALGLHRPLDRDEATRLWRESIGELERSGTGRANCIHCGVPDEICLDILNSPGERRCCDRCGLSGDVHPRPIPARTLVAPLDRDTAGEH